MKVNDDNIGKLFQEKLKDVEVQPDASVWSAIEQQTAVSSGFSPLAKIAMGVLLTAIAVSGFFFWQELSRDKQAAPLVQQEIPVKPEPEVQQEVVATDTLVKEVVAGETLAESAKPEQPKAPAKAKKAKAAERKELAQATTPQKDQAETKPVEKVEIREEKHPVVIVNTENLSPAEAVFQPHLEEFDVPEVPAEAKEDSIENYPEVIAGTDESSPITFSEDPTICFGEDAVLKVFGGKDYEWSNGDHTSRITVSPVEQSTYWVIVHDSLGRQYKHDFVVTIDKECTAVFIPSAFTPNGDGLNDVFKAEGLGVINFEMIIFSREGKILFESKNIDMAWDGTYNGELMPSVTYFYQVQYVDAKGVKHIKKGQVTLIR